MSRQLVCPVCGSAASEWVELRRYRAAHLHRCRRCAHVFAGAMPTPEELDAHYGGYPRRPCGSELTLRRYDELLQNLRARRSTRRLLDVGCGVGDFLLRARAHGWDAEGVELDARAREICAQRGLTVGAALLERGALEAGFDVITSFEVLEHMVDPRREVEAMAALLRPGGVLYVTTPNFQSLSRRLLGSRYQVISYPEHLGYFQPSTLDRLLLGAGLRRLHLGTTGFSPGQLYAAVRPRQAGGRKAVDESVRRSLERPGTRQLLKRLVNRGLTELSLGDTLKATYERV